MIYLTLFLTFFEIGLFTFGGGYAMISIVFEKVLAHGWLTEAELLNMIAVSESTPGPIAINAATYIGYKNSGVVGAVISTLGICVPSFTIIFIISLFFDAFLSLSYVDYAFKGIQICVVYLIFSAGIKMLKQIKKTPFNVIILSLTIIFMILFSVFSINFSTIFFILISGVAGVVLYLLKKLRKEDKK